MGRNQVAVQVQPVSDPDGPDHDLNVPGGLLPGSHVKLAGPTFSQWVGIRGPASAVGYA